jgi:hypothetical protein
MRTSRLIIVLVSCCSGAAIVAPTVYMRGAVVAPASSPQFTAYSS